MGLPWCQYGITNAFVGILGASCGNNYISSIFNACGYTVGVSSGILNACLVWFVGFYGISTFVGYLMPNPFLYK